MKSKSIRITKFHLKNFAPIYTAMGIKDFEFDRTTSKNDLVLILGQNGSSKSFILCELTPEPLEHTNTRTSRRFLPNEEGLKEITYVISDSDNIDTDQYKCKIVYSADGRKTVCSFSHKNLITGEEKELNENGNVSSYLDLCKLHLGYDKSYKNIGYLSDDNKSIVSMSYNERNQLMSNWIPSTSEFQQASKIAQKKYNQTKREIEGLDKDIVKIAIGDADHNLESETEKLNIKEDKLKQVRDVLSKANLIQASLNKYTKDQLNIHKNEFKNKLKIHNDRYNKNLETFTKYNEYLSSKNGHEKLQNKIHELDVEKEKLIIEERMCNDDILQLTSAIESSQRQTNTDIKGYTLVSVTESICLTEKNLNSILENIAKTVKEVPEYSEFMVFKSELKDSINSTLNALNSIALISTKIEAMCGKYEFKSIFDSSASNNIGTEISLLKSANESLKQQINNLNETLREAESQSVDFLSLKDKIPTGCNNKTCSLIAELLKRSRDSSEGILSEVKQKINKATSDIEENNRIIEEKQLICQKLRNALYDMAQVADTLKTLDGKTCYLPESLRKEIDSPIPYNVISKISLLIEKAKDFDEYISLLEKAKTLQDSLNNLKNISNVITLSEETKRILKENIDKRNKTGERLRSITLEIQKITKERFNLVGLKDSIEKLRVEKEFIIKDALELENIKKELLKENDYVYNCKLLNRTIQNLNNLEQSLNKDILIIKADIEKMKTSITSLETLKTRKKTLEVKRDLYDFAYSIWNTKTGYPSMLIKDFLDEVLEYANKDLDKSWGGVLNIDDFEIGENEFRVPVIRGDTIIDDISQCSKAEKATLGLALSTAILEVSNSNSDKVLPIRCDEIDGGMDSIRRQSFLESITNRFKDIGCRNIFCITHNNCFENIESDVILLKGWETMISESSLMNKNVIFKYDKAM